MGSCRSIVWLYPFPLFGDLPWFTANMFAVIIVVAAAVCFLKQLSYPNLSLTGMEPVQLEKQKQEMKCSRYNSADRQVLGWVDRWALWNSLGRTFLCHSQKRLDHFNHPLGQLLTSNLLRDIKIPWGVGWGWRIISVYLKTVNGMERWEVLQNCFLSSAFPLKLKINLCGNISKFLIHVRNTLY